MLPVGYLTSLFEFLLIAISSLSDEYVICIGCKSPDTILSKENRLFFLRCEKVTFAYIVRLSYTRLTMGYAGLYLRPSWGKVWSGISYHWISWKLNYYDIVIWCVCVLLGFVSFSNWSTGSPYSYDLVLQKLGATFWMFIFARSPYLFALMLFWKWLLVLLLHPLLVIACLDLRVKTVIFMKYCLCWLSPTPENRENKPSSLTLNFITSYLFILLIFIFAVWFWTISCSN